MIRAPADTHPDLPQQPAGQAEERDVAQSADLALEVGGRTLGHNSETRFADEDTARVARARAGDRQAFGELFARHHGRIFAMCQRLLKDRAEAEDAVQHTFLEAWRCLHRFEGKSRFSTWLTRIAIHSCFGFRRRLSRLWVTDAPEEAADVSYTTGDSPEENATQRARLACMHEVLLKLSVKKRVVFVLADLEGCTAPEIAEILDIPDATVRTRLYHARRDFAAQARAHPGLADLWDDRESARGGRP